MITFHFQLLFMLALGLGCTLLLLPILIRLSFHFKWVDEPVERSVHHRPVPTSGGLGIMLLPLTFTFFELPFTGMALLLLTLVGWYDDRLGLSPKMKLLLQLMAAAMVVFQGNALPGFGGLWGVDSLHPVLQYGCALLILVAFSNAYNLIDGLDGLAGTLGLSMSLCFGMVFILAGDSSYALLSFALAGGLLGFLRFNWHPARIFMGDAGSLSIGFLLGLMGMRLLQPETQANLPGISYEVLLIGLFWLPVFDVIRVVMVRLWHRKSPFSADKNHLHHRLLDLGMAQGMVTLTLLGLQISFFAVAVYSAYTYPNWILAALFISGVIFVQLVHRVRLYQLGVASAWKRKEVRE